MIFITEKAVKEVKRIAEEQGLGYVIRAKILGVVIPSLIDRVY